MKLPVVRGQEPVEERWRVDYTSGKLQVASGKFRNATRWLYECKIQNAKFKIKERYALIVD